MIINDSFISWLTNGMYIKEKKKCHPYMYPHMSTKNNKLF